MAYTWTFELSFLIFLIFVFVSQALAAGVRSVVPMPLIFGGLFIAGFSTGLLPRDMIQSSNMIAVGVIAFNVLVIHSGTMIDLKMLRRQGKGAVICLVSTLAVVLVVGFGLGPLIGRDVALLAPGSILGGGASCAIASRWVMDKNPAVSVFPWMVFMFQGLFSVPIVTWAMKKEAAVLLADFRLKPAASAGAGVEAGGGQPGSAVPVPGGAPGGIPAGPASLRLPADKVPAFLKTTAYYLGGVMLVAVLNKLLHSAVFAPLGLNININITALLFGLLLGQIGLMEKGPLFKSDSYGLLLLGLMGLMANTMANNQLANILRLLPPLLAAFAVSTILLIACGAGLAKGFKMRPARGIILTMNSMMGFPVNGMLIKNASAAGATEAERAYLAGQFGPLLGIGTMLISNAVSIFIVSVMVSLV